MKLTFWQKMYDIFLSNSWEERVPCCGQVVNSGSVFYNHHLIKKTYPSGQYHIREEYFCKYCLTYIKTESYCCMLGNNKKGN